MRIVGSPAGPVLLAALYFFSVLISVGLTRQANGFITLWPSTGFLLAALLVAPERTYWQYLVAAAGAAWAGHILMQMPILLSVGYSSANIFAVLLALFLIRHTRANPATFTNSEGVATFVASTFLSSIAATILAYAVAPRGDLQPFLSFFASIWLGMILVTPPLVAIFQLVSPQRKATKLPGWRTFAEVAAIAILACAATFLQSVLPLLFLPMIAVSIGVLRGGSLGGIVCILITALLGSLALSYGMGPSSLIDASWPFRILFFQAYLVALFCAAWPMAGVLAERERLRIDLAERVRLLDQAEAAGNIGHWRVSPGDNTILWSPETCRIHGIEPGTAPSLDDAILFYHPEDRPIVDAAVSRALEKGLPFEFHARIVRPDGVVRHIVSRGETDFSSRDNAVGLFGILQDVTDMVEARLRLIRDRDDAERSADAASELANTDALTGLPNRRRVIARLRDLMASGKQASRQLSIVLFDVDHFKSVNDRFGHDVGDNVLRSVARVASRDLRHGDMIGRYGGEEFLLLLPGTGTQSALQIAERVRRAIEHDDGTVQPVTISLGVATLTGSETLESLIKRADVALYDAKAAGRNQLKLAA